MSLLCGVGFYLAANQIHGFDIRRKLWQDIVKADGVETELTDLGSNMDGRSLPFPSEELADLDRAVESYLSKYAPDVAERNLPLFHDEQQDLDDTVESYVTNDDPDLADRNFPIIDDQQQELAEQDAALSDLNGDLQDVSKRNSLTMFDLLSEIVKIRDDMQEQIDELKEGWKLGKKVLL